MSNLENNNKDNTASSKRKRIKAKPATQAKLTEADKVMSRYKAGFNVNQIAAQLMIQRSRVEEIITSKK